MTLTKPLLVMVMLAMSSVAGTDIVDIVGKNLNDRDVQDLFSSNIIGRLSTKVVTTYEDSRQHSVTQNWYSVSTPNAKTNEFWDVAEGPVYPYCPFIEFDTEVGFNKNAGQTIYAVEVFREKADYLIEAICSKLAIPIAKYYSLTNIIEGHLATSFDDALWMPNTNEFMDVNITYDLEYNGSYRVVDGGRDKLNVRFRFRKEKMEAIVLEMKRECAKQQINNVSSLTNFNFNFLNDWNAWPISATTGAVQEACLPKKLPGRFERGLRCYREMIDRGFKRVRWIDRDERPISGISSWYEVSGGGIRVRVVTAVSRATDREEEYESISSVLLDVSGLKTLNGVSVPGDRVLPATPDECCSMYKYIYMRQSFDKVYRLIVCDKESFLYENDRLIRVLCGRNFYPGSLIHHMRF